MASGRYKLDPDGRRCFVPEAPTIPPMDEIWREYEKAHEALRAFDRALSAATDPSDDRSLPAGAVGRLYARLDTVHSAGAEGSTATFTDIFENDVLPGRSASAADAEMVDAIAREFIHLEDRRDPVAAVLAIHSRMFEGSSSRFQSSGAGRFKTAPNSTMDRTEPNGIFFYTHPDDIVPAMREWVEFTMRPDDRTPELVRQVLSHWFFEHIHPLVDGNGRVGRLAIPLVMKWKGATTNAVAFCGEEVHENRETYLSGLRQARQENDFSLWCRMMLGFVGRTASANSRRLEKLQATLEVWRATTRHYRADSTVRRILPWIATKPIFTVREVSAALGVTFAAANEAVKALGGDGVIEMVTAVNRNRVFSVPAVLDIFDKTRAASLQPAAQDFDRSFEPSR